MDFYTNGDESNSDGDLPQVMNLKKQKTAKYVQNKSMVNTFGPSAGVN